MHFIIGSMTKQLNAQFSIPDHVQFSDGENGFPKVTLTNSHGTVEVYLHGAHVTAFRLNTHPDPIIWISREAVFADGKAIRGGVPICWPWFGPHPTDDTKPSHGFARNRPWSVSKTNAENDQVDIVFVLSSDDSTLKLWPHEFELCLTVSLTDQLALHLEFANQSGQPATVGGALHSYFNVSEIEKTTVEFEEATEYIDKLDNLARESQTEPIVFDQEVDRVYFPSADETKICDTGFERTIVVTSEGSRSVVIWNPWIEKSQRLGDFPDDGYQTMVCVETANAADDVRIVQPNETHLLAQTISLR